MVYSPALVLVPLGLWVLLKKDTRVTAGQRTMLACLAAAAAASVVPHAKWVGWHCGWSYGPRYLCEILPVVCLLAAFAFAAVRTVAWRRAVWSLVGLSVLIHFTGVFGHTNRWSRRHDHHLATHVFSLHDTQIEAHARHLLGPVLPDKRAETAETADRRTSHAGEEP